MAGWTYVLAACAVIYVFLPFASGSHFRGGIISWTANETSSNAVNFHYRTAWRRSDTYCNSYNVRANTVYYKSGHTFQKRNDFYGTSYMYDSQYYRCLDYSASEDWSEIGNNFTHTFPDQYWWARNWEISFASCCWIHLHGSTYSSSPWILYANVSLSTRPDTGRINQSPFSSIPLSINVTSRTRELIEIPVSDPDGDNVTCRWATDPPSFPFGELNERNCSLTYNGNGPAGNSYPVLLVLEDGLCNTSLQFVIDLIEYQPYECMYHKQLSTWDRSRYYSKTLGNCDQYSINWNSWYRFTGYAGTGMANSCVPGYHCGASASVWMNGSHPSVQEGAVGRTVHISYFGYCYRYNYHLTVRNCSGFYVYKFQYFDNYNCFRLCGNGISTLNSLMP